MNSVLAFFALLITVALVLAVPSIVVPFKPSYGDVTSFDVAKAILLCATLATVVGTIAYRQGVDGPFLLKLFVSALLLRIVVGTCIFIFNAQEFFGGDALTTISMVSPS